MEGFRSSHLAHRELSLTLDQRLSIFIHKCYVSDPKAGRKQEISNLLAMLLLIYPEMKYKLRRSRRCISSWTRNRPSNSATPLNQEICYAFCMNLIERRKVQSAAVLMLSFEELLRIAETLGLSWDNTIFTGDTRLHGYGGSTAGVTVFDFKTTRCARRFQYVNINDANVTPFSKIFRLSRSNTAQFVPNLIYAKYERDIKDTSTVFGLSHLNITSHSASIGKDTQEYINGKSIE